MENIKINKEKFKFKYLPDYASYLLKNVLDEFVLVGIRFCRDENLPILKPFSKIPEEELVALGMDSNRKMLEALAANKMADYAAENARKWVTNNLGVIDKDDIAAEDLTLGFFLRRKIFGYFLDGYTKNIVEQKFIISELDIFTTQEELLAYSIYLKMQHEKFSIINADLNFHKNLLLEAQELGGIGSFSINFKDQSKNIFTPEYKKIFEMDGAFAYDKFMEWVNPADKELLKEKVDAVYKHGGIYEVEYRYKKSKEKRIWAKGFIVSEEGKPIFIRGIVRELPSKRK